MRENPGMLAIHGPIQVSGYGRSSVAVGPDGIAVVRNPYDVEDLGRRFVAVLVGGVLLSAIVNSLWPGHLDIISIGLGILLAAVLIPLIVSALITFVQVVAGTAAAVARPRATLRELKDLCNRPRPRNLSDYVAGHDPSVIRFFVDAADLDGVSGVAGWLRPSLEVRLRSGQVHRMTAHPWWRRRLSALAAGLRDLQQVSAA